MIYGIVGLGVMGGSFAKRLTELDETVYGVDLNEETIRTAEKQNIIKKGSTRAEEILPDCDVVIFCLYPTKIGPFIKSYNDVFKQNAVLLEISGVKSGITGPLHGSCRKDCELVSIHPMCGRESQGLAYSDAKIFEGANFLIIPENNKESTIEWVKKLAERLGCGSISEIGPEDHDRMIAFLSQLTHVIAVSLMNTHENGHLVEFTGDSFRDLTRIARINENMWPELFILNKTILLDEIDQFIASMEDFRTLLAQNNVEGMKERMVTSTRRRARFDRK